MFGVSMRTFNGVSGFLDCQLCIFHSVYFCGCCCYDWCSTANVLHHLAHLLCSMLARSTGCIFAEFQLTIIFLFFFFPFAQMSAHILKHQTDLKHPDFKKQSLHKKAIHQDNAHVHLPIAMMISCCVREA